MSVEYNGIEYRMKKKGGNLTLDLSGKGITTISEIHGLDALTDLKVLKLSNNKIVEIKGLETLRNLIKLDLKGNEIAEIKGLDNLINLKELTLENNQIALIKGLDTLENLHTLSLYGNRITHVKSFQNKQKLRNFLFSGNPLHKDVKDTFGSTSPQKLIAFTQMSESEKYHSTVNVKREELLKLGQEQERILKVKKTNKTIRGVICLIGFILIITAMTPLTSSNIIDITLIVVGFILLVIGTKGKIWF